MHPFLTAVVWQHRAELKELEKLGELEKAGITGEQLEQMQARVKEESALLERLSSVEHRDAAIERLSALMIADRAVEHAHGGSSLTERGTRISEGISGVTGRLTPITTLARVLLGLAL